MPNSQWPFLFLFPRHLIAPILLCCSFALEQTTPKIATCDLDSFCDNERFVDDALIDNELNEPCENRNSECTDYGTSEITSSESMSELTSRLTVPENPVTLSFENLVPFAPGDICSSVSANDVGGTIWEDWNYNGIQDETTIIGIENITVNVYGCDGILLGSPTTNSNGDWSLSVTSRGTCTPANNLRIEHTNIPTWALPTRSGTNNGTTVQFVSAGTCISLGLSSPSSYCEDDPIIAVPCFAEGAYNGANSAEPALVALPYSADGHDYAGTTKTAAFKATALAVAADIGSTYGLAWQTGTQKIYLASFHKRYSGFGPAGPDAIYQFSKTGTLTGTLELDSLLSSSNTAGSDVHDLVTMNNGEVMDLGTGNTSFDGVGKRSFGDIEFSADMETLYVVNLFDRKIYAISIADGIIANATIANSWNTPDATGANRHRPFGLSWHEGKLWVGSVDENGSNAYVHSLDVITGGTSLRLTIPLSYARQTVLSSSPTSSTISHLANWNAWASNPESVSYAGNREIYFTQAILSDIEFDRKSMILGFRDRFGDQSGAQKYFSNTDAGNRKETWGTTGGDILRACFDGINYNLETGNSGLCSGISGLTSAGPGGEEYYHWDLYNVRSSWAPLVNNGGFHWETAQGGLLQIQGKPSILTTAMDPFHDFSGGILKFDNATGRREGSNADVVAVSALTGGYTIYETGDYVSGPPANNNTYAKANGLGDLEAFCDAAPIEIGNYVWMDTNEDGIQDGGETGLDGINVSLYDANGDILATVQTANGGEYYFNSDTPGITEISANTMYFIVVGGSGQFDISSGTMTLSGIDYSITSDSTGQGSLPRQNDSDGTIAIGLDTDFDGMPYVKIITGRVGSVDHTFDFGFKEAPSCTNPTLSSLTDETICFGESFTTSNVTTNVTNGETVTYQWSNNSGSANNNTNDISGETSAVLTTLPTAAGSYSYRLTATNTAGVSCIASVVVNLVIEELPTATVSSPTVCNGGSATVTAAPGGGDGAYTYTWTVPVTASAPGDAASFSTMIGGSYIVTVTDGNNCASSAASGTVTINSNPTATAAIIDATCVSGSSTINTDGTITINGFTTGEKYHYVEASTYTGSATFSTSSTVIPVEGVIVNNLASPTAATDYTVRIFTSDECYVDRTVTLNPTTCSCTEPSGDTPTTVKGTCTGATSNDDATITITNLSPADIAGIVAGSDYTSGKAYNSDANTNASLESISANAVTFSGLVHETQYTIRVFNTANDCYTDFVVTSATSTCCPTQNCGTIAGTVKSGSGSN